MTLAALVLAAGQSSRFGGRKQLADIQGQPMVCHVLTQLQPIFGDHLYTVLGAYGDDVKPHVAPLAQAIDNPDWSSGMGGSIAHGVATVIAQSDYDGLLIALADQVALTTEHYAALVQAYNGACIVASTQGQRPMAPAVFPKRYFPALMTLSGDQGARQILKSATDIEMLSIPEAAYDVDTVEDLVRYREVLHDG